MQYRRVFKGITPWHEHAIHARIGPLLGYDTWAIAQPQMRMMDAATLLDLTLNFPARADYQKCRQMIDEVLAMTPGQEMAVDAAPAPRRPRRKFARGVKLRTSG